MADERYNRENMNIQSIVSAVINNLHSLPNSVNRENVNGAGNCFENADVELRNAFSIPRSSEQLSEDPSTNGASTSSSRFSSSSLSRGFSRLQNYGNARPKARKGKEQSRSTTTGRFEKKGSNAEKGNKTVTNAQIKDLCLLPYPEFTVAPRLKVKAELIGQGLYIDAWPFDKNANEEELRNSVSCIFREQLVTEDDEVVG